MNKILLLIRYALCPLLKLSILFKKERPLKMKLCLKMYKLVRFSDNSLKR